VTNQPDPLSRKDVAVGYAWNMLFGFIGRAVFPILQVFFYRRLGPEQIGIYGLILPIFVIAETMRDAGLGVTYIADNRADTDREGGYNTFAILSALLFASIVFFSRDYMASAFHVPELRWGLTMVSIAMALNGFCTIPTNKLQKRARFRDAGLADFAATLLSFAVALVLVLQGFGYMALVWQLFLKSVIYLVVCYSMEPVPIRKTTLDMLRGIWKHSGSNLFNNLLYTIYTVADSLFVTKMFGVTANGNYNSAYTYGSKPLEFFTFPLSRTLLVAYSRKSEDIRGLAQIFTRTITASILAMFPLYVFIDVFAKPLVLILLTEKYKDAIPLLALLAIYCGCRSVGSLSGNVLVAMKKQIYNVYGWVGAYLTVGLILALQWSHLTLIDTVVGLAAGAVTVYAVNTAAAFYFLKPDTEEKSHLIKALILSAFTSVFIVLFANLPMADAPKLGLALLLLVPLHLCGIGMLFVGSSKACFSKSGLKLLWKTL